MLFDIGINATANFQGRIEIPDNIPEEDRCWYIRQHIENIDLSLVDDYEFTEEDIHFIFSIYKIE